MKRRNQRAFTLIEMVAVVAIVLVLVSIVIPRIVVLHRQTAQERNDYNARQIANAIDRLQIEGGALTNTSSIEVVVSQLMAQQLLCPSDKLTSRQITLIATNGYMYLYGTYDD